ncbi:hypothetical protein HS7_03580 [Sulfolobales archaeon HS-7]|nr:hypothetical protein HS7_03580 [Sulfolobales archaeon HS-7]
MVSKIAVTDEKEIAKVLVEAGEKGEKVAILGTGRHSKFKDVDVEIYTTKLSKFEIFEDRVEAFSGTLVDDIRKSASEKNLLLPALYSGTIGGLVALNEPSTLSTKYGTPFQNLISARSVLPNGKLLLSRYIAGSKGRIGVITKVIMRLYKKPERTFTGERILKKEDVSGEIAKLRKLGPLSLILSYEKVFTVHVTFDEAKEIKHYVFDDGVTFIEESDAESTYLLCKDVDFVIELINKIEPPYAFYIDGIGVTKLFNVDPKEVAKLSVGKGKVISREEVPMFQRLLIRVFNRNHTLA